MWKIKQYTLPNRKYIFAIYLKLSIANFKLASDITNLGKQLFVNYYWQV